MQAQVLELISEQLLNWELASTNYNSLSNNIYRNITVEGEMFHVQCNPSRIKSLSAKTDAKSIAKRACFLCSKERPNQQKSISFANYDILVNPFPIFNKHLTIVDKRHVPQSINSRIIDMLSLAKELDKFTIFYNGANCGASAPDHFHFQACEKGLLPIEKELTTHSSNLKHLKYIDDVDIYASDNCYLKRAIVFKSLSLSKLPVYVEHVMSFLKSSDMVNILAYYEEAYFKVFLFPRAAQRPKEFFATDQSHLLVSPASVEMGGLIVVANTIDFNKLSANSIKSIYQQVCISNLCYKTLLNKISQI